MSDVAPERERVWVLCDGVGQPCLRWLSHHKPSQEEQDAVAARPGFDAEFGPYTWHEYDLTPVKKKE